MTDDRPTSDRLESLKWRWESDKGSRLFLQLADEYRRLGREEDAIAVLDEGLESSPGHVGARVARARCLLALERAKEAADELEKAIESDPTQMVAYRLLVEAYIRLQDADQARRRLQVYGLLNDSDPDIPELDKRIRELERAERTGEWPIHAPQPPADEPADAGAEAPPEEAAEPFSEELPSPQARDSAPALASEGSGELDEAPFGASISEEDLPPFAEETGGGAALPAREESPVAAPAPAAASAASAPTPTPDPFPALGLPEDERRFRSSPGEDLFAFPSEGTGSRETLQEPPAEPSAEPAPPTASPEDPFDLPARPATEAPDLGDALLGGEAPPGDEASIPETPVPGEPPVPPDEGEALEPSAAEAPPEAGEEAGPEQGRPTVTLGRLYLRQGHLDEAEEIFREVLHREPQNEAAREGLDEVALRRAPGIAAADLLDGYDPEAHGEGLTARKRYALRQYLERLRGGGSHVH